ncbi:MAG TPA: hypothetical protein VFO93_19940 [Hymenobacter sp.]|uniref:hypothetical protein n=1 Tax=Hymenobacter sp. TaxID=1898978 RepID=UPI002D7F5F98|nr:hypothetical protein [Hymenobacter sp.]HET9505828.1 hypothetical protein [Hymenobacter sp.]
MLNSSVCLVSKAQSILKLDEKNGFKNFLFGSNVSEYNNLVYSGSLFAKYNQEFVERFDGYLDFDIKSYTQNNSANKIGDLEIGKPTYYFFNKRLLRVDFYVDNRVGKELLTLYRSLYGGPTIVDADNILGANVTTYLWKGSKVNLSVSICKNPYRGSISSNDKNEPPSYFVRYLSIPMLAKKKGADNALQNKAKKARESDL